MRNLQYSSGYWRETCLHSMGAETRTEGGSCSRKAGVRWTVQPPQTLQKPCLADTEATRLSNIWGRNREYWKVCVLHRRASRLRLAGLSVSCFSDKAETLLQRLSLSRATLAGLGDATMFSEPIVVHRGQGEVRGIVQSGKADVCGRSCPPLGVRDCISCEGTPRQEMPSGCD